MDEILYNFQIFHIQLDEVKNLENQSQNTNIVFFNGNNIDSFKYINFPKNTIFISKNNLLRNVLKIENFILAPVNIAKLKSKLESILQDTIIKYGDIKLTEERIVNNKNKKYSILTEIEKNILKEIISKKKCKKDYIKEKILNIKKNIETNSLDSHLTRIRKKIDSIDGNIKIVSKRDLLLITNS